MENELNYSEFIERYLDNEMGKSELEWFEKELDSNPGLQKELQLQISVNKALAEKEVMELRNQLETTYSSLEPEKARGIRFPAAVSKKLMVFTSIIAVLIIGSLFVLFLMNKPLSSEEIYAIYYQPYEASLNFRATDVDIDKDLRTAIRYYENKDFRNALVLFEKILKHDSSRIGLNLYSGISSMEIKEYKDANMKLQAIIDHKHNLYLEQAEWYLGFCYLMTDKTDHAKEQFKQIAEQNGYYSPKAIEILNKMK